MHISFWRLITVSLICLSGLLFSLPSVVSDATRQTWPGWLQSTINLGLELRGGSHLQFQADFHEAERDQLNILKADIRKILRDNNLGYQNLNVEHGELTITPREDMDKTIQMLKTNLRDLSITPRDKRIVVAYSPEAKLARHKAILEQSKEVIRRRIDETGTKEPSIFTQGDDRIIVQLPGVDDPKEVKRRVGTTAKLSFRMVDNHADIDSRVAPMGSEILYEETRSGTHEPIIVKKQIELTGEQLTDAQATTDQQGRPAVALKFNGAGARKFAILSGQNINKRFAIVLDNKVISAPVFNQAIPDGNGIISGSFTLKEANDLALLLRAGSLPAPLKVIEERTIGPSLGQDSIQDGQEATIFAFILVASFMILFYSQFGMFANIALVFNLLLLFAGLSLLQATLTLPGIAGIAMTIGMAVDANVLIYERIKEELRAGTKSLQAIEAGFKRAMGTIVDSNLTTLIGAAALYEFGSGPIRGFGVTLALGIVISMFTALSVTKVLVGLRFKNWPNNKPLPL